MIDHIKVTNYLGESITIGMRNPEQSGFFIKNIEGLGPSKSTINTNEMLTIDGGLFNSSRSTSRNITISLGFYNNHVASIETIRQLSYRYFPNKHWVSIEIHSDNRIACTYGYVESNEPDIYSKDEYTTISIICPNAYFTEQEQTIVHFSGSNPGFSFPWSNTNGGSYMSFGQAYINREMNIYYTGEEETGLLMTARFSEYTYNFSIYNITRGQTMNLSAARIIALTGSDIKAGDVINISTVKGSKSVTLVRGSTEYNILNAIGQTADWISLLPGENVIRYSAEYGVSNVMLDVYYDILYRGL